MANVQFLKGYWRHLAFWQLNVIMWCVFAVLFFARTSLHLPIWPALGLSLFQLCLCLLLTGILQTSYKKLDERIGFGVETAAWIIGLSLIATLIQSGAAHGLLTVTGWRDPSWTLLDLWLLRTMFFWLVYMVWSLFYFWLRAERSASQHGARADRAEAEAQRMELQFLRSQLDPHFLFNALNGIATVIISDPKTAVSMVRELADYLRYSLDHRHDMVVSLQDEIEALDAYFKIEQARFGSQLSVRSEIAPEAFRRSVPCFLLQPLVENAVKYSIRNTEPPWELIILGEIRDGALHLEIHNTGRLAPENHRRPGVGLENLRRRLALHYPERHAFSLQQHGRFVCADLVLEDEPCSV